MGTYLSRTPSSTGSRTIATVSFWVKRANLKASGNHYILEASSSTSPFNMTRVRFADDLLIIDNTLNGSAANGFYFQSDREYRDSSAWYHIFFSVDVTQANSTDGWKLYVNGVQQTKALTYWTQNANLEWSQSGVQMNIGRRHDNSTDNLDGYLAEYYYIDGTIKSYTDFGETDSTTGIWKPKTYSGSYGTNGYRLEFKNAGALGTDTSGNSNTWTVNNAGTGAQVVDTPSNVFATFNPLIERPLEGPATFAEGALEASGTSKMAFSSIALPSSGKWYAEFKATAGTSTAYVGLRDVDDFTVDGNSNRLFYRNDGQKDTGSGESSYGSSWTTGDIISIAANVDDSEVTFYKNGTAQDSGTAISQNCANQYFFVATGGGWSFQANFGNPPFTISSGNADANGFGNFEYAVPSGYYALCTENLNTYG